MPLKPTPRPTLKPTLPVDAGPIPPQPPDESPNGTATVPDPAMVQAKRDLDAGQVDTDMHATPGLDAQRRARLVPGPGGKPPAARG